MLYRAVPRPSASQSSKIVFSTFAASSRFRVTSRMPLTVEGEGFEGGAHGL